MKSHQRGFIPLVAIILLGITAVVGGTIATVSIHNSNPKPSSEVGIKANEPALAPVSPRAESLAKNAEDTPTQQKVEQVEQNKTEARSLPTFSTTSVSICKEINSLQSEATARSLLQDMRVICEVYAKGGYNEERIESAERTLKEKWNLWRKTSVESRVSAFERQTEEKTPTASNEIAQKETYNESSTYPIVTSFSDNHGNLFKESNYNGYQGPYIDKKKVTLRVGDTIRATVEAKDPKGRALEYNWNSNSQVFNKAHGLDKAGYQYSSNNSVEYTITEDDLKSSGETFRLVYQVRVAGTDYYRFGGGQYDDAGFIDYSLQP